MICSKCGNQSPDGVLFCTFCGEPFNQNQLIPVDKQNMQPVPTQNQMHQPVPTQNQMYQPGPFNSTDQAAMEYEDTPIDEPIVRIDQEQSGGRSPRWLKRFRKWFLRKKVLIPSIIGLVLVIGLVIAYFAIFTPKKRVMNAFAATYNEDYFSDSFVLERELGLFDLLNNLYEQGGVVRETAKGAFDEDDEDFKQSFNFDKNNKLKLMSAEFSISLDDESYGGTLIGTPDETYFKTDEMDGYFAIKNSRVYKQLQKSPILEEEGLEYDYDADFDIDWFGERLFVYEDGRTTSLSKESEELLLQELYDYMEVRTAGTQDVKIGGKDKKAKKYHIIIYKSDLKDYIETFEEIYMDEIFEINYASYPKEYRDIYEDSMEQSFEKLIDGVDEDFEMDVYVYHGKVAGFTAGCSFDIDDEEQEISLECSNEGAQNLLTDVSFKYSLTEKNEDVSFVIEKKTDESDDGVEETIKCTVSEEYEDFEGFASTLIITTEVEGDDFSFEVGDENKWGDETLIYVSGDINNIKKGTLLDLTIDNVEIEDEPFYEFNADVYINANPTEADPKDYKFSDKKCYILEEDVEDIEAFYENED